MVSVHIIVCSLHFTLDTINLNRFRTNSSQETHWEESSAKKVHGNFNGFSTNQQYNKGKKDDFRQYEYKKSIPEQIHGHNCCLLSVDQLRNQQNSGPDKNWYEMIIIY